MIQYHDFKTNRVQFLQRGVYLVSRQKLAGPGTHYGICFTGVAVNGGDWIVHLTNKGYEQVTFEEFSRGRDVTIHEGRPPAETYELIRRAREAVACKPQYDLLSNNCEHFARGVIGCRRESNQVTAIAVCGALFLLTLAAKA
jgi:hypothetical protein